MTFGKAIQVIGAPLIVLLTAACSVSPDPVPTAIRADNFLTPDMPRCGTPIAEEAVLVVDTEGQESLSPELAARIGPFDLAVEKPLAIKARSSEEDSVRSARRLVAHQGCDVLLLGAMTEESAIIGDGLRGGNSRRVSNSYLLFHMGQRTAR